MFVYQRVWIELKTQKPVTAIPFRCGVDATPEKTTGSATRGFSP